MGNDNKGRRYDDEFRAADVTQVIDKMLPVRSAAVYVGVTYETLLGWIETSRRQSAILHRLNSRNVYLRKPATVFAVNESGGRSCSTVVMRIDPIHQNNLPKRP
jgi:transposase-like protein